MLVCNVSAAPRRPAVAADIMEAVDAADAAATGNVVFATLVDDPASVDEFVDAHYGEILEEAASANDAVESGMVFAATVDEVTTCAEAQDAAVSVVVAATWNPAAIGTGGALSNGDLTFNGTSTTCGVRSTNSHNSGKYYFEVVMTGAGFSSNGNSGPGIANASKVLVSFGVVVGEADSTGVQLAGSNLMNNGAFTATLTQAASGNSICIAVDIPNLRAWFRVNNNNWNNSGTADPATNTGGVNISAWATGVPIFAYASSNNTNAVCTANFDGSFTYTVPSGFLAWGL